MSAHDVVLSQIQHLKDDIRRIEMLVLAQTELAAEQHARRAAEDALAAEKIARKKAEDALRDAERALATERNARKKVEASIRTYGSVSNERFYEAYYTPARP